MDLLSVSSQDGGASKDMVAPASSTVDHGGSALSENGALRGTAAANGGNERNGTSMSDGGGRTTERGDIQQGDKPEEQPLPKEDPMVEYTDEFGRVRTMRQRWAAEAGISSCGTAESSE